MPKIADFKAFEILRILRLKAFRYFFLGNTISLIGDSIFFVAIVWWVYDRSGTALSISYVVAADLAPMILFGSLFGVIIDRFKKKTLLIVLNTLQCLVIFGLLCFIYYDWCNMAVILAAMFLNSLIAVGKHPLMATLTAEIGKDSGLLAEMNTLMQFGRHISSIFGAFISGLLLAQFGAKICVALDVLSFTICICFLLFINLDESILKENSNYACDLMEGIKYFKDNQFVFKFILITALISFFVSSYLVMTPVIVKKQLDKGPEIFGLLNAMRSLGGVATILIVAYIKDNISCFYYCVYALGMAFVGMTFSNTFYVTAAIYFVLGFFDSLSDILALSILQKNIQQEYMGRVFGIIGSLFMIVSALSYFCFGFIIENITIGSVTFATGVTVIILGLTCKGLLDRDIRLNRAC